MTQRTEFKIRKMMKERARSRRPWPAELGDGNGTVAIPGYPLLRYVRPLDSDIPIIVYKGLVPDVENYPVMLSRDIYSRRPRIIDVNEWDGVEYPPAPSMLAHAESHYIDGYDPVFISDRQVVETLVYASSGMTITVNAGYVILGGQVVEIDETDVDLTANIPVSGALYALVRADSDGTISIQEGTPVANYFDLDAGDIPKLAEGYVALGLVRLYADMSELSQLTQDPDVRPLHLAQQGSLAMDLEDLVDVTITAVADNDILAYDSGSGDWINQDFAELEGDLDDLADVTIAAVADNDILAYDSGSGDWINQDFAELEGELDDLADVTITDVADNDILAYDSGSGDWINQDFAELEGELDDLADVTITDAEENDVIIYDGYGNWINQSFDSMQSVHDLDDLDDVTITDPEEDDLLIYNGYGEWVNLPAAIFGGISELDDLTDVDIIGPIAGQALMYDGYGNWVNDMPAGSGDMTKAVYDTDNDGVVDNAEKLGGQDPSYYAADANVIHDNVAAEISAIDEKEVPITTDEILIEDSEDGYSKKSLQIGNLPYVDVGSATNLLKITFDEGTTSPGQGHDRTTGGSYTVHGALLSLVRSVRLTQVLWDIKKAGTYTLVIKDAYGGATLYTFDAVVVAGDDTAEVVFTPPTVPIVLIQGIYYFQLTCGGSVTWDDNNIDSPVSFSPYFTCSNVYYGTTAYPAYSAALKLVGYWGTISLVDL